MYKLQNQSVKRLSDGAIIPLANGNRDYEEYRQWLSEGNTPEPEFTDAELKLQKNEKTRQEAQEFLRNSDFKVLPDYFATLTKTEQNKLVKARAEARAKLK